MIKGLWTPGIFFLLLLGAAICDANEALVLTSHPTFPQQSVITVFEIPSLEAFPGIWIWLWRGWIADCHPKSRICEPGASCTWDGLFLVGNRGYRSPSVSQGGWSVFCGDARGRYISRTWLSCQWASNAFLNTSSQADMKESGCVGALLVLVATPQPLCFGVPISQSGDCYISEYNVIGYFTCYLSLWYLLVSTSENNRFQVHLDGVYFTNGLFGTMVVLVTTLIS